MTSGFIGRTVPPALGLTVVVILKVRVNVSLATALIVLPVSAETAFIVVVSDFVKITGEVPDGDAVVGVDPSVV